jgi:hypothetical protein
MSKSLILLPVAFVLGGLVGYMGPSADLRELRSRTADSKTKASSPADGFGSFARIVNIPEVANPRRMRRRSRSGQPAEAQAAKPGEAEAPSAAPAETQGEGASADAAEATPRPEGRKKPHVSPEDLRARIDEAADLWRARADIARVKACDRLSLDEEGQARFEEALDGMNERLRESIQTIADLLEEQESMTPELGIRLMGDLSTTLAETYDAVGACVGEDMRGEVSNLNLTDFVDPSVAEPLIAVQGKLDVGFPHRGGRAK